MWASYFNILINWKYNKTVKNFEAKIQKRIKTQTNQPTFESFPLYVFVISKTKS